MVRQTARVPSEPRDPVAKCHGYTYMTGEWTGPADNGGCDITGYVIKYGSENTHVDDYATVKVVGDTTKFTFTDQLNWGMRYQFAVAAENTAGRGEFSEFSDYGMQHVLFLSFLSLLFQ